MLPLVITIKQVDGGTRRYAFAESPVSIGRSPFAELQLLEPFISRWEGTLRFDAIGGSLKLYLDGALIGSANDGSFTSGKVGLRTYLAATYDDFSVS